MGQKVNPIGLRLGVNRTWDSRWFADGSDYAKLLHEDLKIREFVHKKLGNQAGISKIIIAFFNDLEQRKIQLKKIIEIPITNEYKGPLLKVKNSAEICIDINNKGINDWLLKFELLQVTNCNLEIRWIKSIFDDLYNFSSKDNDLSRAIRRALNSFN